MAKKKLSYADTGVDIDAGDAAVDKIKGHIRRTYGPRVLGKFGSFAGCFRLDYNEKLFKRNYKDPVLVSCADGVGSKVKLAVQMGILDTVGQDCVAMNINDLIVQGAEPLFFLDYIGIYRVDPNEIEQIVKGVADGCQLSGCSLIGGETAELPDIYEPKDFDLAGFSVGVCELKRIVDGSRTQAGDVILGLASSGVHSNGYSLVRAIIKQAKLDINKIYPELDPKKKLGEVLLTPTRIYAKPVVSVLRKYTHKQPVSAMSHITGGGLPGNVNRTLSDSVDAKLSRKSWKVPPIFKFLQKHGNVDESEMLRVFNMGVGYVMIVRPHFADSIKEQLRKAGETVYTLGKLTKGTGKVILK
ncbi:phosphoribosylformylglycinamidine cyclo-ligase [bacterium AH-315-I18]|nr:phosphoribosylformylglycinamidine cyclo-ligase [bacterium AH-315-I18]